MSTYYYMGCDKCKRRTGVILVSRAPKDHLDNADEHIQFLFTHRYCNLRLFSEHDDDRAGYDKEPLPAKAAEELILAKVVEELKIFTSKSEEELEKDKLAIEAEEPTLESINYFGLPAQFKR